MWHTTTPHAMHTCTTIIHICVLSFVEIIWFIISPNYQHLWVVSLTALSPTQGQVAASELQFVGDLTFVRLQLFECNSFCLCQHAFTSINPFILNLIQMVQVFIKYLVYLVYLMLIQTSVQSLGQLPFSAPFSSNTFIHNTQSLWQKRKIYSS